MQVSKKKVNQALAKQIYGLLYQTLADLRGPEEIESFLKDFLTKTEQEVLAKRLAIAYWLSKSRSYENIRNNLAVSSTTIAAVQKIIKKKGVQLALKKIAADEWANKWVQKLGGMMSKRRSWLLC